MLNEPMCSSSREIASAITCGNHTLSDWQKALQFSLLSVVVDLADPALLKCPAHFSAPGDAPAGAGCVDGIGRQAGELLER